MEDTDSYVLAKRAKELADDMCTAICYVSLLCITVFTVKDKGTEK